MSPDEHNAIKSRWLATYKAEFDYSLFWKVLAGTGLIIIAIIYWNRQLSQKVLARTSELSESESRFRAIFEQAPFEYITLIWHFAQQPKDEVLEEMQLFMEKVVPELDVPDYAVAAE